ncbi:MAG TPA: histidine phosphatase family protein [Candidatus Acidoferrales bacterium]|nr:histidine phosphatase family protein [Candidatus Acidoferrales bacterium]
MAKVYLARHGETTWNLAGRYQGRRESALSALGVRQAIALAGAFTPERSIERVVSSPLLRCAATAKFVADALDLEVETDERLIEIAHGTWEGRLRDEIAANDPERYRAWRKDPARVAFEGGETLAGVQARWREFAERFDASRETLVVTHDAVVRVALLAQTGGSLDDFWKMPVENAAYAVFDGAFRLVEPCVNAHLDSLRADVNDQAL